MKKAKFKDVSFVKCYDYNFGERSTFWRADLWGETIATLCHTKAECIEEVRNYLKKINS
jgi:hypothetical protein